jgi:hypothetical protein
MSIDIGFALITHSKPHQSARLVRKLNSMFGFPPIAWHHDFAQCPMDTSWVTNNVAFVRPHLPTAWGKFSLVEAGLAAIDLLLASKDVPAWIVLLSGADYPIKSAGRIRADLMSSQFDAHIAHERIRFNLYDRYWQRVCHRRYCAARFRVPTWVSGKGFLTVEHPLLTKPFLPFSERLSCFAGEFWFCANRTAVRYLTEFHRTQTALAEHYRRADRFINSSSAESYFQTAICNSADLRISTDNFRYIDWRDATPETSYLKLLTMEDLPGLRQSTAHFARKFDPDVDSTVLDALDVETEERDTC